MSAEFQMRRTRLYCRSTSPAIFPLCIWACILLCRHPRRGTSGVVVRHLGGIYQPVIVQQKHDKNALDRLIDQSERKEFFAYKGSQSKSGCTCRLEFHRGNLGDAKTDILFNYDDLYRKKSLRIDRIEDPLRLHVFSALRLHACKVEINMIEKVRRCQKSFLTRSLSLQLTAQYLVTYNMSCNQC